MAVHEVITDKYIELIPYNGFTPAQIVARATQVGGYPKYDQSSSAGKVRASRGSLSLIQSMIGYSPGDGGRLIRQRAGGYPSGTWSETESAFDNTTGVLKANELPRWNIFSGYTPGEWFLDNGALNFRFVRSGGRITNPLKDFAIFPHLFFGYNHAAETPQFQVNNSYTAVDGALTVSFIVGIKEMKFPDDVTHLLAEVVVGANTQTVLMSLSAISNAGNVSAQSVVFSGVAVNSLTVELFCSNSSGTKLATMGVLASSVVASAFAKKTATITHTTMWNYIARSLGAPEDLNVLVSGTITIPAGSTSIALYAGNNLSGVRIRINSSLLQGSYSTAYFELYLAGNSRNIYIGSYQVGIGTPTDFDLDPIVFNPALAGGENLGFIIQSLTYS